MFTRQEFEAADLAEAMRPALIMFTDWGDVAAPEDVADLYRTAPVTIRGRIDRRYSVGKVLTDWERRSLAMSRAAGEPIAARL